MRKRLSVFLVALVALTLLTSILVRPLPVQGRVEVTTSLRNSLPSGFTSHMTTINGLRYHYVSGGKGEAVVLLHGWPETWYEWRKIMPTLALHYTVIVPDLRGAGESAAPSCCYEKKTVADDVYRLVHQLGLSHIFLVGHDIGGMIAYAYAAAHPTDIRRLVILEAPIPNASLYQFPTLSPTGVASGEKGVSGAWQFGFHVIPALPEELITGKVRVYLSWFYHNYAYTPTAFTNADIDEYVRHYSVPASLHAGFEYYRALFQDIADNKVYAQTKLTMPVLALGGDHGAGNTVFKQMQSLGTNVHGGILTKCGHWVAEEQPTALAAQLLAFLH